MDVLLHIIIAIVVVGVFLAVLRFAIAKWFPEFADYFRVLAMVACAALFVYCLIAVWPLLAGGVPRRY